MIKAVLFDLDDTLLGNELDGFMTGYFSLLSEYARPIMDAVSFLEKLVAATRSTIHNTDPQLTNADVFWERFLGATDLDRNELEPFFFRFYETEFPRLRAATHTVPAATEVVQQSFKRGLKVVIATNPLFPRMAIEQRLAWAGVPVTIYDYDLVTTYENMHAAKPQPAYYEEILAEIDVQPGDALMVGDDWKNDIIPAHAVGLHTYWVAESDATRPDDLPINGQGDLAQLAQLMASGWLEALAG
jgi:HAD superfamily hydrolase (TIGR01549 family)